MASESFGEALWEANLEHMRLLYLVVEACGARGESGLLLYLYHFGKPMYPGELTEKLGLTTGRIANILKVLERSGMITRTPDARDRRRVLVSLTPSGVEFARHRYENAVRIHSQLISALDEKEVQQLIRTIQRLAVTAGDVGFLQ